MQGMARAPLLALACATAFANEFNKAVPQGIRSELTLALKAPWAFVDFESEVIESGAALEDDYETIDFDILDRVLFSGIKAAPSSVFMHYVAAQKSSSCSQAQC